MSNMVTQTIMARYHAHKARALAAEAAAPAPAPAPAPATPAPLAIPFDAATLVCASRLYTHTHLACAHARTLVQDPVPSVETLQAALLARAAHDPVLTDIPLTDVYRAGALAKHA